MAAVRTVTHCPHNMNNCESAGGSIRRRSHLGGSRAGHGHVYGVQHCVQRESPLAGQRASDNAEDCQLIAIRKPMLARSRSCQLEPDGGECMNSAGNGMGGWRTSCRRSAHGHLRAMRYRPNCASPTLYLHRAVRRSASASTLPTAWRSGGRPGGGTFRRSC